MKLICDIETDGLLEEMTKIHSICAKDVDTGEMYSYRPWEIDEGVELLQQADTVVFHNGVSFDVPAIQKLYPGFEPKNVEDTLVLSRLAFGVGNDTKLKQIDYGLVARGKLPGALIGSHALEAHGHRLGILKGTYGKQENAWDVWTEEMQEYCKQDVEVTEALYFKLMDKYLKLKEGSTAFELEHTSSKLLDVLQVSQGFHFDQQKARELAVFCEESIENLINKFSKIMPPSYSPLIKKGEVVVNKPKRRSSLQGANGIKFDTEKDAPYTVVKVDEFTGTDADIIRLLKTKYSWVPEILTDKGNPKVGAEVLETLNYDCIPDLLDLKTLKKMQGYVSTGKNAWLKLVREDGTILHRCQHIGAVTHRVAHSSPNLGQIPASRGSDLKKRLGGLARSMFGPPKGFHQVGCDLSGIEVRMLAHYLCRYDGGRYAKIVLDGDVHWETVLSLGIYPKGTKRDKSNPDHTQARDDIAKTFLYAWMYGAGAGKLMSILGVDSPKKAMAMSKKFARALGIDGLKDAIQSKIEEQGYFYGLDGRIIYCDSLHKALNYLLQSAGAIIAKRWMVMCIENLRQAGFTYGVDYYQLAFVHDEVQYAVRDGVDDAVFSKVLTDTSLEAGEFYKLNIRIDAEAAVGSNWNDCH